MSVAVQAGYSVENAVSACTRDMERLYEPDSDIVKEFRYIESQQRVSVPVEELFFDLGERILKILPLFLRRRSGREEI